MKVTLVLNNEQKDILKSLTVSKLELDLDKCYSLTQYIKLYSDKNKKIIHDANLVLHGHEYDRDETNVYWLVLTNSFDLVDLCIPLNVDTNYEYSKLSEIEIKIVKLIMTIL
jgi:hypothetical protein